MPWTERQRAMLVEMGLAVWQTSEAVGSAQATETIASAATAIGADRPAVAVPKPDVARPFAPVATAGVSDASERAAAIASMEWPALRRAVVDCTACGLCGSRQQTVFGSGHERAAWMIVGEAPGENEDLQGQPFVGSAGRLLDRMLLALGLGRDADQAENAVYIANTLKCRPPRNRNPEPQELSQCLPFLERQVALVKPRVILAMGRFAVQALLGSQEPIGRLRGQVHQWRDCPVIVTYHPAYLLRQPTEKARAWADLCLAADVVEQTAPT